MSVRKTMAVVDLNLDDVNFEHPTFTVTRRKHTRNELVEKIAEDVKRKLTVLPINDEKNLQGCKMVHDAVLYEEHRQNNPLHRDGSKDLSIWSANAHPTRHYRRTYEFTKPNAEYFGTSQWR